MHTRKHYKTIKTMQFRTLLKKQEKRSSNTRYCNIRISYNKRDESFWQVQKRYESKGVICKFIWKNC